MRNHCAGQSILEYVIVLTVIVAAIAVFSTQYIRPALQKNMQDVGSAIRSASSGM